MPTRSLPPHPHDLALLLVKSLTDQKSPERGQLTGYLPVDFNFAEVDAALEAYGIGGFSDEATRHIEFHPSHAAVYVNLDAFFAHPANLTATPDRFTILDLDYTHGTGAEVPKPIAQYLSVVQLCGLLTKSADHVANSGTSLHFIKNHDAKVEVKLEYIPEALVSLPALDAFASDFVDSTHHQDQKRTIVRTALLETFKGSRCITVTELLPRFDSLIESVRNSYAMYVAEFSFEKIRAEVEKDNLDSTLKLNKTISDIQNQLLAIPVALMLVGGQMLPEDHLTVKNLVIWIGSMAFGLIMNLLISNQHIAIKAIDEEIRLRKAKIDGQPSELANKFKKGFIDLQNRGFMQARRLEQLEIGIFFSYVFSTALLIWFSCPLVRL